MTLWWIGNAVFLLVVIPVVILILNGLLRPAREIKRYADDLEESAGHYAELLDPLGDTTRTRDLVVQVRGGLERYGAALERLV